MTWNYRVVKRVYDDGTVLFTIHEAYYDETGKPSAITENPTRPQGETFEELQGDMEYYQMALSKPILNWEDFQ